MGRYTLVTEYIYPSDFIEMSDILNSEKNWNYVILNLYNTFIKVMEIDKYEINYYNYNIFFTSSLAKSSDNEYFKDCKKLKNEIEFNIYNYFANFENKT